MQSRMNESDAIQRATALDFACALIRWLAPDGP